MKKFSLITVSVILLLGFMMMVSGCGSKKEVMKEVVSTTPPPPIISAEEEAMFEVTPPEFDIEKATRLATIYFDFDKYNLLPEAETVLNYNGKIMRENPSVRIQIEGHCDERGTIEYNLALGEKRAQAARDYLGNYGISSSRISIISYGEERPVDDGHDEEAWAKNRRDEFIITSK